MLRCESVDTFQMPLKVLASGGSLGDHVDDAAPREWSDPRASALTRVVRVADCVTKIIDGDADLNLDGTLRAAEIDADGDRLLEQTEIDRQALVRFLAADFQVPRSVSR